MIADVSSLRVLPKQAADLIRPRGKWTRGTEVNDRGAMCLTGALIRACTVPGDGYIAREVYRHWNLAERWNDQPSRKKHQVVAALEREITEQDLAETFGPQWAQVVALVRRAARLTAVEVESLTAAMTAARVAARYAALGAARDAAWDAALGAAMGAAWAAARDAAWDAARDAAMDAAMGAAWAAAWDAAMDAAMAAVVRDRIGSDGFTQQHYDTLTGPWRQVIGPVDPDDVAESIANGGTQ